MTAPGLALLGGVRVVDFTQALSGPYCTLMLADLGADVVKVENPKRGDDARHWGPPFVGPDAAYFVSVNRNKRSVALDLKQPEDLQAALDLIATADVVVENWRPGTAARLGLAPDRLRTMNPKLTVCSISGFGQDQGTRTGYDQILQGTSGVMSITGPPGAPTKWGVPIGDIASGMFAATAIVAALHERESTGVGRIIDIAMQDSLVSMLTHHAARYLASGVAEPSVHNMHATIAPYGMYEVADGFINMCVGNDSQFLRMCEALDRPDLAVDERFATNPLRVTYAAELNQELARSFGTITVDHALEALHRAGVPSGPVRHISHVLDDEATGDRAMVMEFTGDSGARARVVNTPWKFDGLAPVVRMPPPRLGQHNHELIARHVTHDPRP
ncbi:MAG TPA: CoA transferase [Streptosporangiaceae bacterium]|jgi:crotonobetainyl-CoA:carnitine CoA-transferase CaiB-like acyl-CoA transferase|nr:CoA transferase [Streptosporangiaceae bacterium]